MLGEDVQLQLLRHQQQAGRHLRRQGHQLEVPQPDQDVLERLWGGGVALSDDRLLHPPTGAGRVNPLVRGWLCNKGPKEAESLRSPWGTCYLWLGSGASHAPLNCNLHPGTLETLF